MNTVKIQNRIASLCALCAAIAISANSSHAASVAKETTGTDLTAGASWVGAGTPTSADTATWQTGSLGAGLTLPGAASWLGIAVTDAASDIDITGVGPLTLGTGGIDLSASLVNLTNGTPITLGVSQTWTVADTKSLACSGVVSGTGLSLTKAGTGTLTLSGANSFNGGTTIRAGTIQFSTATALGSGGTVTLGDGSTGTDAVSLIGVNGPAVAMARPIVVSASGSGPVTVGRLGAATGPLNLTGGITLNRDVILDNSSSGGWPLNIDGAIAGTGNVTVAGNGFRTSLRTAVSTFVGNVTVATTSGAFLQIGAVEGATDHIPNSSTVTVNSGAYMRMSCASESIGALNGAGMVDVNAKDCMLTIGGGNGSGTFSGTLSNASPNVLGLTKTGTGTQVLSGANGYTSNTIVLAGALLINSPGSLAAGTTVSNLATLGGDGTINGPVVSAAGSILTSGSAGNPLGALTLAGTTAPALTVTNTTLQFNLSADGSFTSSQIVLSDPTGGVLNLNGANLVSLATPNGVAPAGTYTLMTYASTTGSGTLALDHVYPNASLTVGPTSVTLTVTGAGTFGSYVWRGDGTANVWDINTTSNWAASGTSPTLMTYLDNYSPVVFDDTGSNTPAINITTAVSPINTTVSSANNYTIGGSAITGTGGLIKSGAGTLTLNGANTYSGNTTISGGKLTLGSASALPVGGTVNCGGVLDLNNFTPTLGLITGGGQITNIGTTLTISNTASGTFSGVVPNKVGGTSVVKNGSGAQTFGGANAYTGGTLINEGTLGITAATALGTGTVTLNGGTLNINTVNPTNAIVLNSTPNTIAVGSVGYQTVGPISGTGGFTLSTGFLQMLTNAGVTFQGNVTIASGAAILRVVGNEALPSTVYLTNNGNLRLDITGGGSQTLAGLAGNSGFVYVAPSQPSLQLLRVGAGGVSSAFGGVIGTATQGANLAVEKIGAGTFTLTGTNSHQYQGTTTVSGGTLLVDGSVTASSGVTVAATATLGGAGSISAPITVQSGAALAPGNANSVGTLTNSSSLDLGDSGSALTTSRFNIAAGGNASVTTLNVNGTNTVNILDSSLVVGTNTLITYTGPIGGSGFAGFKLGTVPSGVTANLLDTGTQVQLAVTSVPSLVNTNATNITFTVSGSQLTLGWPADHTGWRLQVQTNTLAVGLKTNWFDVAGSTATNQMTFTKDPANPTVFYRMVYP